MQPQYFENRGSFHLSSLLLPWSRGQAGAHAKQWGRELFPQWRQLQTSPSSPRHSASYWGTRQPRRSMSVLSRGWHFAMGTAAGEMYSSCGGARWTWPPELRLGLVNGSQPSRAWESTNRSLTIPTMTQDHRVHSALHCSHKYPSFAVVFLSHSLLNFRLTGHPNPS